MGNASSVLKTTFEERRKKKKIEKITYLSYQFIEGINNKNKDINLSDAFSHPFYRTGHMTSKGLTEQNSGCIFYTLITGVK